MLIEVLEPLKVRLPGGQLRDMVPGQPVDLPDEAARKLLAKAPDRVKVAGSPLHQGGSLVGGSPDWLAEWRELAARTAGLLPDDPRRGPVLEGLARCDEAFLANDYRRFLRTKAAVLCLMKEVPHE